MNLFGLNSHETKRIVALYLACEVSTLGDSIVPRAEKFLTFLEGKP